MIRIFVIIIIYLSIFAIITSGSTNYQYKIQHKTTQNIISNNDICFYTTNNFDSFIDSNFIDNDENIYLILNLPNQLNILTKVTRNFEVDQNFANNGYFKIPSAKDKEITRTFLTEHNNSLFIIGTERKNIDFGNIFIYKIGKEGKPDTSFGQNGKNTLNKIFNNIDYISDLEKYNEGFICCGYGINQKTSSGFIIKFDKNWNLDKNFATNGILYVSKLFNFSGFNTIDEIEIDSNNQIYFAGSVDIKEYETAIFIGKVLLNSKIDNSFANNGLFTFKPQNYNSLSTIEIVLDNKNIYLAGIGYRNDTGRDQSFIIKTDKNGKLDHNFNMTNPFSVTKKTNDISQNSTLYIRDITKYQDSILVTGEILKSNKYIIFITNISKTGEINKSFGNNGTVFIEKISNNIENILVNGLRYVNNSVFILGSYYTNQSHNSFNNNFIIKFTY
ncbi:MAG: hypothetical protein N2169_04145 [bacterium]|nr:hypothetical protein [bacterium]